MLQISLEEKYDIQIILKILKNGTKTYAKLHMMRRRLFFDQSEKCMTDEIHQRINVPKILFLPLTKMNVINVQPRLEKSLSVIFTWWLKYFLDAKELKHELFVYLE